MIAHLGHAVLLLLIRRFPSGDVGLQTLVEVDHAGYRVGNGEDDEDDCDNRCYKVSAPSHVRNSILMELTKGCQTPPSGFITRVVGFLIHPDQLEDEISQGSEQDSYDESHGNFLLPPGAPSREDQECDGEREYGNREVKFVVPAGTGNWFGCVA